MQSMPVPLDLIVAGKAVTSKVTGKAVTTEKARQEAKASKV
jgi:hypothetical protein